MPTLSNGGSSAGPMPVSLLSMGSSQTQIYGGTTPGYGKEFKTLLNVNHSGLISVELARLRLPMNSNRKYEIEVLSNGQRLLLLTNISGSGTNTYLFGKDEPSSTTGTVFDYRLGGESLVVKNNFQIRARRTDNYSDSDDIYLDEYKVRGFA